MRFALLGGLQLIDDRGAPVLGVQPRTLVVAAFLLMARPRGLQSRDRLLGLFWPELPGEQARAALRKALQRIREAFGEGALLGNGAEHVGLALQAVECDALRFEQASASGRCAEALDGYTGELLAGVHVPGSSAFDTWLSHERARLHDLALGAAWNLVERLEQGDELTHAGRIARRVARLANTDERMVRKVLLMLDRLGDRAGALEVYRAFAAHLQNEFEVEPSDATREIAHRLMGHG